MAANASTGWQRFDLWTDNCADITNEDDASKDLALVRLPGNVDESIVHSPLIKPYLGDLQALLKSGFAVADIAGYGGNAGPDFGRPLLVGTYPGAIHTDDSNWWVPFGISSGSWWIYTYPDSVAASNHGDSGGPLAILKNSDQTWYQIGVTSGTSSPPTQAVRDLFSPLQNNGDGNGSWMPAS